MVDSPVAGPQQKYSARKGSTVRCDFEHKANKSHKPVNSRHQPAVRWTSIPVRWHSLSFAPPSSSEGFSPIQHPPYRLSLSCLYPPTVNHIQLDPPKFLSFPYRTCGTRGWGTCQFLEACRSRLLCVSSGPGIRVVGRRRPAQRFYSFSLDLSSRCDDSRCGRNNSSLQLRQHKQHVLVGKTAVTGSRVASLRSILSLLCISTAGVVRAD